MQLPMSYVGFLETYKVERRRSLSHFSVYSTEPDRQGSSSHIDYALFPTSKGYRGVRLAPEGGALTLLILSVLQSVHAKSS